MVVCPLISLAILVGILLPPWPHSRFSMLATLLNVVVVARRVLPEEIVDSAPTLPIRLNMVVSVLGAPRLLLTVA